jgi:hypothetical protein
MLTATVTEIARLSAHQRGFPTVTRPPGAIAEVPGQTRLFSQAAVKPMQASIMRSKG